MTAFLPLLRRLLPALLVAAAAIFTAAALFAVPRSRRCGAPGRMRFSARKFVLLAVAAIAWPASGHGQIVFTITGTGDPASLPYSPDGAGFGYAAGEAVTFTFTLNSNFAANASSSFSSSADAWVEELTSESMLFTAVSGTRLTGSFQRPAEDSDDPYSTLIASFNETTPTLELRAAADLSDIGLFAPTGEHLYKILVRLTNTPAFDLVTGYTQPAAFFSAHQGTFNDVGGLIGIYDTAGASMGFTVTSLTIANASAVPEPSTWAGLLGAVALLAAGARRRGRTACG